VIRRALPLFAVALVLTSTAGAVSLLAADMAAKPTEGRENVFPAWSPDGTRIAFASSGVGSNDNDIWVVHADGTGLLNLTPDALNEGSHSWSPDGTRLAITSAPVDASATPSVEVIDAAGGGRRALATGSLPAWSPDGTRIAYDGEGGFHVVEVVGGHDRLVAPVVAGFGYRPSWSPDGLRITYVFESNVWVVDFDGSDQQRLTSFTAGRFATAPVWSPDGQRIAYVRDSEVWVVAADGSDTRRLASFTVARIPAAPTWSPDGSTIAFVVVGPTSAPEPNDVWTIGEDGTGLRRVMSAPFVDGVAHWGTRRPLARVRSVAETRPRRRALPRDHAGRPRAQCERRSRMEPDAEFRARRGPARFRRPSRGRIPPKRRLDA
jgi:Tol biopolymer transport system component